MTIERPAWLEGLPQHWGAKKARYLFAELNDRNQDDSGTLLSVSEYYGVKPRSEVIGSDDTLQRAETLEGYRIVRKGDLAMNIMLAWKGAYAISEYDGIVSPSYAVFRPSFELAPQFIHYLLRTEGYKAEILKRSTGIVQSRLRLYPEDFKDLTIPLPPLEEQQIIAAYLDRETGRIDALVERLERLIALLTEKRQAVISHAVTKGLNPDAPMKDSGIDWLGEVPAHWEIMQFRRVLDSSEYGISASLESDGTVPVLRMGNIQDGEIDYSSLGFVDEVDEGLTLKPEDILFNRTNSLALVGKAAIYRGSEYELVSFASYLVRFRTNAKALPEYINFWMGLSGVMGLAQRMALPSISQANLNPNRYSVIRIAVPPAQEQATIVQSLIAKCDEIERIRKQTVDLIETLKERRYALISAAVTGQIPIAEMTPDTQPEDAA